MIMLPILTTSLIHFYPEGWENVLFELGGVRFCAMRRRASGNSFTKNVNVACIKVGYVITCSPLVCARDRLATAEYYVASLGTAGDLHGFWHRNRAELNMF